MKIGLDTNLIVRYLTDDDPEQADAVEELFRSYEKDTTFVINEVVLAELNWVLISVYNYSKANFIETINQIFNTRNITFSKPVLVKEACEIYAKNEADFSDCYLGVLNRNEDCETTFTFDKKASQHSNFTLLGK